MSNGNSNLGDQASGPDGPSVYQHMLSPDVTLTWAISALRAQSRGFLNAEQFINVMGLGAPHSVGDRDASLDRVVSKLHRVLDEQNKRRMPE